MEASGRLKVSPGSNGVACWTTANSGNLQESPLTQVSRVSPGDRNLWLKQV